MRIQDKCSPKSYVTFWHEIRLIAFSQPFVCLHEMSSTVVLITGCNRGLGLGLIKRFLAQADHVGMLPFPSIHRVVIQADNGSVLLDRGRRCA